MKDVVQKFRQLEGADAHGAHNLGLLDRREVLAHLVHAAAGRGDDVVVAGEIAHEELLGGARLRAAAGVGHRLAAAGLVERVFDLAAKAFQKLQSGDANLWLEGVDVAGDEKSDAHDGMSFQTEGLAFIWNAAT